VKRVRGDRVENLDRAIEYCLQALEVHTRQAYPEKWAMHQIFLAMIHYFKRNEEAGQIEQAIHHYQQALEVFILDQYPEEWGKVQEGLSAAYRAQYESKGEQAGQDYIPSYLTYPQFYIQEAQLLPGKPRQLKLVHSIVPDFPYQTVLVLEYQWEAGLPDEEAANLAKRAIAYISCAIYDAAVHARLVCQPSPIPNGRRPAWILEGEKAPVSLTLSDIDQSGRSCQMTIAAVMVSLGQPPSERTHWERLHESFRVRFSDITV
jgi:tetratricopeptide (TPR) repeat protein